jgi:hypothetical protein
VRKEDWKKLKNWRKYSLTNKISTYLNLWKSACYSHHKLKGNNWSHDRKPRQGSGIFLDRQCPAVRYNSFNIVHTQICKVTRRSSIITSLVKKSAPIVALYLTNEFSYRSIKTYCDPNLRLT